MLNYYNDKDKRRGWEIVQLPNGEFQLGSSVAAGIKPAVGP
jgi:hypothetical protein